MQARLQGRLARVGAWQRVGARGCGVVARAYHAPPSRVLTGPTFILPDSFFQNKTVYGMKKDINEHKKNIYALNLIKVDFFFSFTNIHVYNVNIHM